MSLGKYWHPTTVNLELSPICKSSLNNVTPSISNMARQKDIYHWKCLKLIPCLPGFRQDTPGSAINLRAASSQLSLTDSANSSQVPPVSHPPLIQHVSHLGALASARGQSGQPQSTFYPS